MATDIAGMLHFLECIVANMTMQTSDVMSPDPISISPEESIGTAIEVMQNLQVRHVPVIDERGALVGMLSDRDVSMWLIPYFRTPEKLEQLQKHAGAPVATIMTSAPIVIDLESDSRDAAELMLEHRIGAVPVVDGDGALVGIVSYVDLLRHYTQLETDS